MALFEAAYPGTNWRKLSHSGFHARLRHAGVIHAILSGTLTDKQRRDLENQELNTKILLGERFDLIFPPDDEEEED